MPDVMLGGGSSIFTEATVNNRTLLQLARDRGCNNISTSAQLAQVLADPSAYATAPLLGLFSPQHMPYVIDKQDIPSLADMIKTALAVLKTKGKPFILFVEGSRIDHALHENDAAAAAQEVLAYDDAFAAAVAFADAQGAKGTGSASPTTVVRLVYFNATTHFIHRHFHHYHQPAAATSTSTSTTTPSTSSFTSTSTTTSSSSSTTTTTSSSSSSTTTTNPPPLSALPITAPVASPSAPSCQVRHLRCQ